MKVVQGYIRNIPNGTGVSGVSVNILDDVAGTPIPSGGMIKADASPQTTNGSGFFRWTAELSPGPIRVQADIVPGSDVRIRSGQEMMQAGDIFVSDTPVFMRAFTNGVFKSYLNALAVTASGVSRLVTVNTGAAFLGTGVWEIVTTRDVAVPANTTLASRQDLLVLRQYVAGTYHGKQDLVLVGGTVNAVDPTINTDPNILEFPIARVTTAQNAATSTVTDLRVYAGVAAVADGSINYQALSSSAIATISELVFDSIGSSLIAAAGLNKVVDDAGNTTTLSIPNLGVVTAMLADQGVTAAKIANGTITAAQIAALTITAAQIANGTITNNKLAAGAIPDHNMTQFNTAILTANRTLSADTSGMDPVNLALTSGVTYDIFSFLLGRGEGTPASGPGSASIHVVLHGTNISAGLPFVFDNGVDSTFFNVNYENGVAGGSTYTATWMADNFGQQFTVRTGRLILIAIPRS